MLELYEFRTIQLNALRVSILQRCLWLFFAIYKVCQALFESFPEYIILGEMWVY